MMTDNGTSGHIVQRCFSRKGIGLADEDVSRRTIAVSIKGKQADGPWLAYVPGGLGRKIKKLTGPARRPTANRRCVSLWARGRHQQYRGGGPRPLTG